MIENSWPIKSINNLILMNLNLKQIEMKLQGLICIKEVYRYLKSSIICFELMDCRFLIWYKVLIS